MDRAGVKVQGLPVPGAWITHDLVELHLQSAAPQQVVQT